MVKKAQPKRQQSKKTKTVAGPRRPKTSAALVAQQGRVVSAICSQLDPFCSAARGAKLWDGSSAPSLAISTRGYQTLTTNASGNGALFFVPDPFAGIGTATIETYTGLIAAKSTNSWAAMDGIGFSSTTEVAYRLVSGGIRLRSIMSAMDNSGELGIAQVAISSDYMEAYVDIGSVSAVYKNLRVSANDPAGLIAFVKNDAIVSKEFGSSVTPPTDMMDSFGTTPLVAYVIGGKASANVAVVEYVYNWEITFLQQNKLNSIATKANPSSGIISRVSADVRAGAEGVIRGGYEALKAYIHHKAKQAFIAAATGAGGYYGGPAGAAIAGGGMQMIMDVD